MWPLKYQGREVTILAETIVSIGSNLGDKKQNILSSIEYINLLPETHVTEISKIYKTLPFKTPNKQDNYMNCCAKVLTELSPQIFLGALLGIEAAMGRKRKFKFCERIIDIDLIFYENLHINEKNIIVPHPRAMQRAFVLVPLNDICKDFTFKNINFREHYAVCDKSILINL